MNSTTTYLNEAQEPPSLCHVTGDMTPATSSHYAPIGFGMGILYLLVGNLSDLEVVVLLGHHLTLRAGSAL